MLPSVSYQFMILDKACTKVSCKTLLPCKFKCNLLRFIWVDFILFAWSINEKNFSFHYLAKCTFTSFALVRRWSFRGIILDIVTLCFLFLRVMAKSTIEFCNQFWSTVFVKVISANM